MNYYPNNYYPNYSYNGMYPQYGQQQAQPIMQPPVNPAPQVTTQPQLQGKIVDGEEMVKATEVPFGGYGIFPKADLSEVYIKTWNNNGTTQITSYQPIRKEENAKEQKVDMNAMLLEKMQEIEIKIDNIVNNNAQAKIEAVPAPQPVKKEVKANAY